MIELLSPVGDFECLKAAVQNGADCVYFGSNSFSARAFASNFDDNTLKNAINYAKTRGVKTNLTLNTLIKNNEFKDAYNLAKKAYEFGIDAIIVQDLGLGLKLIKDFPDLPIHASTQMSVHNLQGVLALQKLGFKRVVLARELSADEIAYICKNSDVEIECFIHGALCVCYSGQCLFSSMIGGRSGNRGKCAQPCRLNYELFENNKKIDNGYLLSTRDLLGLDYIPFLINCGVTSFKIEGRMKNPEYVATVTRIYRKYIDIALSKDSFKIDEQDRKNLLQVFNRGLSSTGHLSKDPNKNLVYKSKPNNMGLPLGIVQKYNKSKGYITLKLKEKLEIGDTISLENETGTYTVSELMDGSTNKLKNIPLGLPNQLVTIGRMKGNISIKDNVFKISSKELSTTALNSFNKENKKILLNIRLSIKKNKPIFAIVTSANNILLYKNLNLSYTSTVIPVEAKNKPITKEDIIKQISKTGNTPFDFKQIIVDIDDNIFIPKLSSLNELRRIILDNVQDFATGNILRKSQKTSYKENETSLISKKQKEVFKSSNKITKKISILLNILNTNFDYSKLENIDNIYIPLKYFANKNYSNILETISQKFNLYIYLPTIIKANYRNLFHNNIENAIIKYNIKGFVISNISNFVLIEDLQNKYDNKFELISNYTLNIYNDNTINELYNLGISKYTISPELDKNCILSLNNNDYSQELIVYGKIPLVNMNYCLLGKTNKCYPGCEAKCSNIDNIYYLKDRLNMNFEIIPDNIQTVTTIYNSKILSISPLDFKSTYLRLDFLHEDIETMNNIITTFSSGKRLEGKEFTNGNLNREI